MPLKRVTIGKVVFEGDSDNLVGTVSAMADMDGVMLPYEFIAKLSRFIDSIPRTSLTAFWMTLEAKYESSESPIEWECPVLPRPLFKTEIDKCLSGA